MQQQQHAKIADAFMSRRKLGLGHAGQKGPKPASKLPQATLIENKVHNLASMTKDYKLHSGNYLIMPRERQYFVTMVF